MSISSGDSEAQQEYFWVWTQGQTYAGYVSSTSPEAAIKSYAENRQTPYGTRIYAVPAKIATRMKVGVEIAHG